MKLRLPWPPSINYYYRVLRNIKCRNCGHVTKLPPPYITPVGRKFRQRVGNAVWHKEALGEARLAVRVDLYPPRNIGDIDNYIKPLLDALEHAGLFDNDEQVKDLRLVWQHPVKGGATEVQLWEI